MFHIKQEDEVQTVGDLKEVLENEDIPNDAEVLMTIERNGVDYDGEVREIGWNDDVFIVAN